MEIEEAKKELAQAGLVCETFIKPKADISEADLAAKLIERAGVGDCDKCKAAAYYIAAFYSKQDLPLNGMLMWGSRDLKKFASFIQAEKPLDVAVSNTRSVMAGRPENTNPEIEEVKAGKRKQAAADAEARRQAYLASDEYKHMQDPGWRGPNGTWSND